MTVHCFVLKPLMKNTFGLFRSPVVGCNDFDVVGGRNSGVGMVEGNERVRIGEVELLNVTVSIVNPKINIGTWWIQSKN